MFSFEDIIILEMQRHNFHLEIAYKLITKKRFIF